MTAILHSRTPSLVVNDARGLPIREVEYLRKVADAAVETLITRHHHDTAGRWVAQWDPRLFGTAPQPNQATIYTLSGEPLNIDSVDAGWRLSLPGLAAEALEQWDARGNHRRTTYDGQLRVIAVEENAQPNVERFTYADHLDDAERNLRGRMLEQLDPSGTLRFDSYGLLGQPLRDTRTLHDADAFLSSRTYGPLGAVLTLTDAGDHRQQLRYDLTGQLRQVQLLIKGATDWQPVLQDTQYNAAGQIEAQTAGNEVRSTWVYDPANGRLNTQQAQKNQEPALQHFDYFYDPAGNITRIFDHTFTPSHFANQRVDGHREFTYDSLYRLTCATGHDATPPSDFPGRPLPSDPNNHLNYRQEYEYDAGGNLIKLIHGRAMGGYTHQMRIDPLSNRGVRWKPGDPEPDFATLFDRHGNLQALQPGQALHWNGRDQLAAVTLVEREDGRNDEEIYRYSQGARVYKRHESHASTTSHFHQVIYLPGLEIRTRDNGEALHVINLPGGRGSVRCLHWVSQKPDGIEDDQLRYSLDDHLGSSLIELDHQARLISHEGYYPFGGTAWLTADSALRVSYKTIRYSGKEMDVSGLYYYGLRYYAPWLQRWISPDPLWTVDGLNLYRMVGNNPINFVDDQGGLKQPASPPPQQISIQMSSASSSRRGSAAPSAASSSNLPARVDNPAENPPGKMPPEPGESWRQWSKRMALAAVNSKAGLALLPVATSSPANAAIVATILTAATQLTVQATLFNPAWSPPGTWDPAGDGSIPPSNVTQEANRIFNMINTSVTLAGAVAGAALGPIVGGYVEELRGTKLRTEKKAEAGKMSDTINRLIAEQRLLDNVTLKAQTALRDQVLEVESLVGITWKTMEMLEKIDNLRPGADSLDSASSRRGSAASQRSGNGSLRYRAPINRTPLRTSRQSIYV